MLLFSLALLTCLLKNLFPSPSLHLNFLQEGLVRTPTLIRISCELIGSFFGGFTSFEIKMQAFLHCPFPELRFQQRLFLRKAVVLKAQFKRQRRRRRGTLDAAGQPATQGKAADMLLRLAAYFCFKKHSRLKPPVSESGWLI